MSVPKAIAKEDSKLKAFRKEHRTCQEYKKVPEYKTQQVFKRGKKTQNHHLLSLHWPIHNEKTATSQSRE